MVSEMSVEQNKHTHPQTYMNLTTMFLNHCLPKPCLILCDWALESMLKAIYVQERESIFSPFILTFEDLLDLLRYESGVDIEALCLVQSIKFLANSTSSNNVVLKCSKPHLQMLIRKVDELLCKLSPRAISSTTEMYNSIFK